MDNKFSKYNDGNAARYIAGAFVGFGVGLLLAVALFLFRGWM